jgi:TonB family protein
MTDRCYRSCPTVGTGTGLALIVLMLACLITSFPTNLRADDVPKPHRKVLVKITPEYPLFLRAARFEGQVRLEATVLPNGSVSKVEVKGGNPVLSQYASQAVMRWKYAPAPAQTVEEVIFDFNSNPR